MNTDKSLLSIKRREIENELKAIEDRVLQNQMITHDERGVVMNIPITVGNMRCRASLKSQLAQIGDKLGSPNKRTKLPQHPARLFPAALKNY